MRRELALFCASVLTGCAPAATPIVPACPPLPDTRGPLLPAEKPDFVHHKLSLEPGHWDWDASAYVWVPPRWVATPANGRTHWVNGFWTPAGGGCFWTVGRFVS